MGKIKSLAAWLFLGAAVFAPSAHATPITGTPASGLSGPGVTVIDFEEGSLANGTIVTNQFTGVTFGPTYLLFDIGSPIVVDNFTGRYLNNSSSPSSNPGNISFDNPVTAAGFHLRTDTGSTTFSAYLMGGLVESFAAPTTFTSGPTLDNFFGFRDITFDEIRYTISASSMGFSLDNLQYIAADLPEPGTLALFGLGLAGLGAARRRARSLPAR